MSIWGGLIKWANPDLSVDVSISWAGFKAGKEKNGACILSGFTSCGISCATMLFPLCWADPSKATSPNQSLFCSSPWVCGHRDADAWLVNVKVEVVKNVQC